ncbi:MAG: serine protease [Eubacterium sp.]|nr:serine protease [Eubacterium sp.]
MGNGMTDADYKALVARIAIGRRENLSGSGVLYIRNWNEVALVLTSAHVLAKSFDEKNRICIFLDFYDKEHTNHSVSCEFTRIVEGEPVDPYKVFYSSFYDSKTYAHDIAFISIPWENWMETLPVFDFKNGEINKKVYGWGYPEAMTLNSLLPSSIEETCADIRGIVGNVTSDRYMLTYDAPTRERNVSRDDEMPGFSGSGLFECDNGWVFFTGCLSCSAGHKTAGSRVWVASGNAFRDMVKAFEMAPSIPKTFASYKEITIGQVDEFSTDIREFLIDAVDRLIEDKNLVPSMCVTKDLAESNGLLCQGDRKRCKNYWKGQLTKAICFCEVLGIEAERLSNFEICEEKKQNKIRVEFLCTEEKINKCIQLLLDKSSLKKSLNNETGIIFLWNDEGSQYYSRVLKRKESRRIVRNIVSTPRQREQLSKKSDFFNIVDGDIEESNLAIIGMGELFNSVIFEGEGKKNTMSEKFSELVSKAWEV